MRLHVIRPGLDFVLVAGDFRVDRTHHRAVGGGVGLSLLLAVVFGSHVAGDASDAGSGEEGEKQNARADPNDSLAPAILGSVAKVAFFIILMLGHRLRRALGFGRASALTRSARSS